MPPSSSQEPPEPERYCAMANHRLKQPSRNINDPHLLRFAQRINSEMRLGATLCLTCYQKLINIYKIKMANARRHQQARQANSVSDVSSSQRMESSSDPSTVVPSSSGVTMRRKLPVVSPGSTRSSASNDETPSTSTTAAKRMRTSGGARPGQPAAVSSSSYISDDDDPNSNLSLNAVNGTRLPHIQPIPKRTQFVTLNKKAMDIYLAGTTGG